MVRNPSIEDLILELTLLNIRQREILDQLTGVDSSGASRSPRRTHHRAFRVGDRVIILNPSVGQESHGVVVKIGPVMITVLTLSGRRIRRAPHNLRHSFE